MQGIVDKCLRISKTLMRRISGGGENVLKVNVYIETDNGSKKKLYRGYGCGVSEKRWETRDTESIRHVLW